MEAQLCMGWTPNYHISTPHAKGHNMNVVTKILAGQIPVVPQASDPDTPRCIGCNPGPDFWNLVTQCWLLLPVHCLDIENLLAVLETMVETRLPPGVLCTARVIKSCTYVPFPLIQNISHAFTGIDVPGMTGEASFPNISRRETVHVYNTMDDVWLAKTKRGAVGCTFAYAQLQTNS